MSNSAIARASRSRALTAILLLLFSAAATPLRAQQNDVGIVSFGGVSPGGLAPEKLSITVEALPGTGSVRFFLNGLPMRVDDGLPFAWLGRIGGEVFAPDSLMLADGDYVVTAIAYPQPGGAGTPSAPASIEFTVDNAERRAFLIEQLMAIFSGSPPPIAPADRGLGMNGIDEYLANLEARPLSISADFTLSIWLKPAALDHRFDLVNLVDPLGSLANGFFVWVEGDRPGRPLRVSASDRDGRLLRNQAYNNRLSEDTWTHVAIAHRRTGRRAILAWFDGTFRSFSSRIVGAGSSIDDEPREVWIGAGPDPSSGLFDGVIGHVALFDRVLTGAQVAQIAAGGHAMDLRLDTGDYDASSGLVHYWRPGWLTDDALIDFADVEPLDLMDSSGIEAENVVADAPPALP